MLVLLFGVSCVGKSTLINELIDGFGWRYIPTYMTRPLRKDEIGKVSISKSQFNELKVAGYFVTVNDLFGNLYGTPLREVREAVNDITSRWILDFPISRRHLLDNYPHIGIVVLPESIEQLTEQVRSVGREERLTDILEDYNRHYAHYQEQHRLQEPRTFVIVNSRNKQTEAATRIQRLVEGTT